MKELDNRGVVIMICASILESGRRAASRDSLASIDESIKDAKYIWNEVLGDYYENLEKKGDL